MCIGFLGNHRPARVGSIISVTCKEAVQNSQMVRKGDVNRALIIRQKKHMQRADGSVIRFSENACVLLSKDYKPLGTRVNGPVPLELRKTRFVKLMSLAPAVV